MKQRRPDLPAYLRFVGADSLNVSLVKKDPVWRTGKKDAFLRARDAVKQAQQQSSALRFLGRQVFHDNRYISEPFTKRFGQAAQSLRNKRLELGSLHFISDCNLLGAPLQ